MLMNNCEMIIKKLEFPCEMKKKLKINILHYNILKRI